MLFSTTCGVSSAELSEPKNTLEEIYKKTHEANQENQADIFYRELHRLQNEMSIAIRVLAEKIDELKNKETT